MKNLFLCILLLLFFQACFSQQEQKVIVYFRFDESKLDSSSKSKIDQAVNGILIHHIRIEAHCDSFAGNTYNDALSMKRATSVKEYLISKISDHDSILIKGFGKRAPLNRNENSVARALNRRAEIFFTVKTPEIRKNEVDTQNVQPDVTAEYSTIDSVINIEQAEIGSSVRLENLNFYGGQHILLPKSEIVLEKLLNTMRANPTLEIEIQGHICCQQGEEDGMDWGTHSMNLSVNRAKMVYDYLIKKGIDRHRLSYRGFGSRFKLVEERTEEDKSTNRRVEIKILKK